MKVIAKLLLAAAYGFAGLALCAAVSGGAAGFTFADWQVSTSEFSYNWDSGVFAAPQHITLTRPGSTIDADRANGNEKQRVATLYGNVVLHDSRGTIAGIAGKGSHAPATLTCDRLDVEGTRKMSGAIGRVHFVQGASRAGADRANLNGLTHNLQFHGHVHLVQ